MMQRENTTRRKSYRLTTAHRRTGYRIFCALETDNVNLKITGPLSARAAVKRYITRLANIAGIERTRSFSDDFESALKTIYRRADTEVGFAPSTAYRLAELIGDQLAQFKKEKPQDEAMGIRQGAAIEARKTLRARVDETDESFEVFGVLPGDCITAELCEQPELGDLLVIAKRKDTGWTTIGRFVRYDDEPTGREIIVGEEDGYKHGYKTSIYAAYKAIRAERGVALSHGDEDGDAAERARELARLRRRLEGINGDDITNCSARMRLEKQIYDLEHPIDTDDWSAWEV